MFKISLKLAIFSLVFFLAQGIYAQSLQKSNIHHAESNQKRLINGTEILVKENQLQQIQPSSIQSSTESEHYSVIQSKEDKATKLPKALKYGIRKDGEQIRRDDD